LSFNKLFYNFAAEFKQNNYEERYFDKGSSCNGFQGSISFQRDGERHPELSEVAGLFSEAN
jgi:hypothetical protein